MSRTIHVVVTADDIASGKPRQACACPIALSLGRSLSVQPTVYLGWAYIQGASLDGEYDLPQDASDFIEKFDNGHTVEPFEFDMSEVPYDDKPVSP